MSVFFITAIDTDIGKTIITGSLAKSLGDYILKNNLNKKIITQKIIQTGNKNTYSDDIIMHRKLMHSHLLAHDLSRDTCPYTLKKPASPHLSLLLEKKIWDSQILTDATANLLAHYDIILLEGAGGVLVPLNQNITTLDYISAQNYPVCLVTCARLGSINHTLLSLSVINQKAKLHSVIYNDYFDSDLEIAEDFQTYIKSYLNNNFPNCAFIHIKDIINQNPKTMQIFCN